MTSKREEERNEKIIRGLMKLPPNRRCINCNSLGPQYVCINFWTFVCTTCSGVHREFTHRVKSVSMSKFTSQEVEALQKGGNQRAREIYLKNWDVQGQRLPNGSDAEKVREFIKNVYVDKKFAGGKNSEKPPRDTQSHQRSSEEEMRRASSYHSFSQSPPNDFQYEERHNRKQGAILTRKPGSDRGLYERKVSSLVYSPGRFSDPAYEEQFANEGSISRVSDYSFSSGGDPFRSSPQSPNSQKDSGFNSSPVDASGEVSVDQTEHLKGTAYPGAPVRDAETSQPQRTTSGSLGSLDNRSASLKSVVSGSLLDAFSEVDQSVAAAKFKKNATFSSFLGPSASVNYGALDLFDESSGPQPVSSSSSIDLFQLPVTESSSSINLFPPAADSAATPSFDSSQNPPSLSLSMFNALPQENLVTNANGLSQQLAPKDQGWATFDLPQHSAFPAVGTQSGIRNSAEISNPLSPSSTSLQWPDFQSSTAHESLTLFSSPWHEDLHNVGAPTDALNSQDIQQERFSEVSPDKSFPSDIFVGSGGFQDFDGARQKSFSSNGAPLSISPSAMAAGSSFNQTILPVMTQMQQQIDHKPGNPFDFPYDSELEASNVFLEMSSLTAALPSTQSASSFVGSIDEPWFASSNDSNPCVPVASQGGIAYMSAQAASSQLQNVQRPGPVASLGGNPFA